MNRLLNSLHASTRDESGATAIEYGLIAGLIAVVIIAAVALLGGDIERVFNSIANAI